ncbi:hypothetical protein HG530_011400 [Fusarium avenaceum]|nr:hypothetical protein HG530_011400 [Fusarium avenaceum]
MAFGGGNLAGDTSLELNNFGIVDESETTQNTLTGLELVHLGDAVGLGNRLLCLLDLLSELDLGVVLTLSLAEVEDDNRVELLLDGHSNNLGNIRSVISTALVSLLVLSLSFLSSGGIVRVGALPLFNFLHNLVEVLLVEVALLIDNESGTSTTGGEEVVLKRRRSEIGVDDVTGLVMDLGNPLGKLESVGDGGGEKDISDLVGKHDNGLLPDDTSYLVSHVVNLVKHDPSNFSHDLGTSIQHRSQNLSRHDQTTCCRVDSNISSHETNVSENGLEISVLLVTQSLDGTCVDNPLVALETLRDSILGHNCLSGRSMRGNENTLLSLNRRHGETLEGIELEIPRPRRLLGGLVLRKRDVFVV